MYLAGAWHKLQWQPAANADPIGRLDVTGLQERLLAPLLGIVGSVQALETLKVLAQIGEPLQGRLLLLDGLRMEWNSMRFRRDPHCPVCGPSPSA